MTPARRRLARKVWARIKTAVIVSAAIAAVAGVWVACVIAFVRLVIWAAR